MKTENGAQRTENRNRELKQKQRTENQKFVFSFQFLFLFTVYSSLFSVFFFSCSPSSPPSPILAKVNSQVVTLAEFQRYLQAEQWKYGEIQPLQAKAKLLDAFLKDQLLLAEAKEREIVVSSEEVDESLSKFKNLYPREEDFEGLLISKGWSLRDFAEQRAKELTIQKLGEAVVAEQLKLPQQDLQNYYEQHKEEFQHPEQVHARQIVTDSKEKVLALREMLIKRGAFEEVALKYSLSPDRKRGGDLGWFGRGVMPKEFDAICFSLPVGELSPVIQTAYGYHLFEVLEKRPAGEFSFAEVQQEIRETLKAQRGREVFQKFYEVLRAQARIEVYANVLQQIQ